MDTVLLQASAGPMTQSSMTATTLLGHFLETLERLGRLYLPNPRATVESVRNRSTVRLPVIQYSRTSGSVPVPKRLSTDCSRERVPVLQGYESIIYSYRVPYGTPEYYFLFSLRPLDSTVVLTFYVL